MNTQDNRFLQQIGNAKAKVGDVLARALFGEEIQPPTTTVTNEDGTISIESGINNGGRKGGLVSFINDARKGMTENSSQGFDASNLYPNREKGAGFRIGEAAGSALRLLDNPIARGAIAYGLSKRMGDENPLGEALTAAISTQQNKMKDRMYRQALAGRNIDTSDIRGWLGDDTFKYLLEDQQVRDNAAYRNALLQSNLMNQREMMDYRKQEAVRKARQDAIDTDIAYKNLGLKEKELAQRGNNVKPLSDTQVKDLKNLADALNDANGIIAKYSDSKYDAGFGISGAVRRNPLTSKFDPLATEMRQDIDLFRKTVARAKEGGRLTDQDQKYYEKAVLNPNLSREDFLSLAREFKNKIEQQRDTALDMYELQGKNVNNFRDYYQRERKGNTTQNGIKYEVID